MELKIYFLPKWLMQTAILCRSGFITGENITIIMRPLMVSAGKHAYVDMAGEKKNSWLSLFKDSHKFEEIQLQIKGMGRIEEIQQIYLHKIKDQIGAAVF